MKYISDISTILLFLYQKSTWLNFSEIYLQHSKFSLSKLPLDDLKMTHVLKQFSISHIQYLDQTWYWLNIIKINLWKLFRRLWRFVAARKSYWIVAANLRPVIVCDNNKLSQLSVFWYYHTGYDNMKTPLSEIKYKRYITHSSWYICDFWWKLPNCG